MVEILYLQTMGGFTQSLCFTATTGNFPVSFLRNYLTVLHDMFGHFPIDRHLSYSTSILFLKHQGHLRSEYIPFRRCSGVFLTILICGISMSLDWYISKCDRYCQTTFQNEGTNFPVPSAMHERTPFP